MNNEDLHFKIDFLSGSGVSLSSEEKTLLQNSLLILKKNNKFTHVRFWGKVYGVSRDYYIAQGYSEEFFKSKKTFSSTDAVDWVHVQELDKDSKAICARVAAKFTGDPATETALDEKTVVTEEKRLSYLISSVDFDCSVVPRGAFILNSEHRVIPNSYFSGLPSAESEKLTHYYHLREPEKLPRKTLLEKEGLVESIDFLDPVHEDIPLGCWTLTKDKVTNTVTVRSLHWPGYYAFHVAGTNMYGSAYFGNGERNYNLGFML